MIKGQNLKHWKLENNTVCVAAEIAGAPVTCIDLWFKAGSYFEEEGEEGLAHFLEHMVFKGSNLLKPGEFDLRIEELGGSSNAATGFDDVHFHVLVPPKAIETALELLLNLVLTPTIREEAYELERQVVLEEIAQYKDQPEEQVFEKLLENCWSQHSYGRSILGFEKSLKSSTPINMKDFHNRLYTNENCCLALAGAIPNNIIEIVNNSYLQSLNKKNTNNFIKPENKKPYFKTGSLKLNIPRLESARVLMAWEIPAAKNQQELMGIDIGTSILTEGRRSRLVQKLREDLKIVESIDIDITPLEQSGLLTLEACCIKDNVNLVIDHINKQLNELSNTYCSDEEINRAKLLVRNGIYYGIESSSQVAAIIGSQGLWNRHQPLLASIDLIEEWTKEKLKDNIFSNLRQDNSFTLIAEPYNI